MKNKIINEFQILINGTLATRPKGWQFKIGMYKKAQKAFRLSDENMNSLENANKVLKTVFKNPDSLLNKIKELYESGKINQVEKIKTNPTVNFMKILISVPYIGQSTAKLLIETHNITTIEELRKNTHLLNENQVLGLKYYDKLIDPKTLDTKRIPRSEISKFHEKLVTKAKKHNMVCEIAGSYRRKLESSGDIDIILTGKTNNMEHLINDLEELKEHFVKGKTKWMGIGIIDKLPRRVDIMFTKTEMYPFALMYFTGSQEFNEKFRGYARTLGYTLNEHEIKYLDGRKVNNEFKTEKDIFEFLQADYISPEKRITFMYKPVMQTQRPVSVKSNKSPKTKTVYNVSKGVTLAESYDSKKHKAVGMLMSEKYDGVRAIWNGESMRSRVDKAFYPPVWFTENLPNWIALDGELFTERGKFQNTVSIVKKISPVNQEWRKITFNVFDSPTLSGTYMERYTQLQSIIKDIPYVKLVTQTRVTSDKQMEELYKKVLEKGGEGLVLRNPSMNYIKKRTKDLLKVKPTDDNEGIIINMIEGKGKDTGRMGALVVELKNNRSIKFKIGTGFTDALRQNFWNKKQNYKNRLVTFSYKGLTNAGKPRHPVYVRMRNLQ